MTKDNNLIKKINFIIFARIKFNTNILCFIWSLFYEGKFGTLSLFREFNYILSTSNKNFY